MKLFVLPEFESDAMEIEERLEHETTGYGEDFRELLDAIIENVVEFPQLYSLVGDGPRNVEAREAFIRRFEYRVIYVLQNQTIFMLSLVHARRHPGSWTQRIDDLPS